MNQSVIDWIEVNDWQPEPLEKILIWDGYEIYMGYYRTTRPHWCVNTDGVTIDGDASFGDDDTYGPITHWCELPTAPSKDKPL